MGCNTAYAGGKSAVVEPAFAGEMKVPRETVGKSEKYAPAAFEPRNILI